MRTGIAAALGMCVMLLAAPGAVAQQYTGTYAVAGQGGSVTLTLRQAADGQLTGTMSGNGTEFAVEGIVEEGVAMGAITNAQGGVFFEATLDGDQLTLTLVEVGAGNMPDYSKTRTLLLRRGTGPTAGGGGAAPTGGNPLAGGTDPFSGTFSGDGISLTLSGSGGAYRGNLSFQGSSYPLQGRAQGTRIEGSFTADGQSYPFTAVAEGAGLVFETAGARYALTRSGGSGGAAPANPLGGGAAAARGGSGGGLVGRWACQTGQGMAQLAFLSDRELEFNGERTSYQLTGGAIQIPGDWGPVVYQYRLESDRLLVTDPAGGTMQCQRQAGGVSGGVSPGAAGGGMEALLQGPRCSYSSSALGGYSTLYRLYFDGQGRFTSGSESSYSGDPGSAYGLHNNPNAGMYQVSGASAGAEIQMRFPDGSTAVAYVRLVENGQIVAVELNGRLYAASLCE